MTNSLQKIYENVLRGTVIHQSKKSLTSIYEQVVNTTPTTNPTAPISNPKPTIKVAKLKKVEVPKVNYDQVIARALGDKNRQPNGDYKLGVSGTVDASDMDLYKMLFPITPPKTGEGVDSVGTKGSGNGEIALYWLLSKNYQVQDNRDAGKPDLEVYDGRNIGVEVKAYDTARMGLGRFGDQRENRALLSIIFGIHALLREGISTGEGTEKRAAPSIDSFNRHQLTAAFQTIKQLVNNTDLRDLGNNGFNTIKTIYDQIEAVLTALEITSPDFTPEEGAAKMLLLILITKLRDKPGFNNFIINMTKDGKLIYHRIPTEEELKTLKPETILNFVNANAAALIIKPDAIFKNH
jgi:hypothetical protein